MSINVSSPKQSRIPEFFLSNPIVRKYVEYQREVLFKLWTRTGAGFDAVSGKKITTITDTDTVLTDTAYGEIIVVLATTGTVQITLPPVIESRHGESVIIVPKDTTNNITIIPVSGTVNGGASVVVSTDYENHNFSPIETTEWVDI